MGYDNGSVGQEAARGTALYVLRFLARLSAPHYCVKSNRNERKASSPAAPAKGARCAFRVRGASERRAVFGSAWSLAGAASEHWERPSAAGPSAAATVEQRA